MAGEDDAVLDGVLEALANPHRREIVYVLGLQPCAVSQLARMRGLSLPAIHKHIKVLENAAWSAAARPAAPPTWAWGEWFKSAGPHLVDPGSPFGRGVELTRDGRAELTLQSPSPLVGYCILNAGSPEEAESLVRGMPIIESVRIYEAHSM